MKCLIVDTQADRLDDSMIGFLDAGLQVMGTSSLQVAQAYVRRSEIDVLVFDQSLRSSPQIQLVRAAEVRNTGLITLVISSDVAREADILTQAYPSVHCILGEDVDPRLVAKLALASLAEKTESAHSKRTHTQRLVHPMSAPVFHSARAEVRAA